MKKTLLSLFCAAVGVFSATAADVTDVLTVESLGYNGTNNTDLTKSTQAQYEAFSDRSVTSPAVWAGNAAQQVTGSKAAGYVVTGNMQLRWDDTNASKCAGLVTTTSGGTAKSVKVTWGTASTTTGTKAKLVVYGSNEPYESLAAAIKTPGTDLLSFDPNVDTSKDIDGSYKYIFIHSEKAACYIKSIEVTWVGDAAPVTKVAKPQIKPNGGEITAETKISLSCSTDAAEIWYAYIPEGVDAATVDKVKYTEPFAIPASGTVEAIAKKDGLTDSDLASAKFTIPEEIAVGNIGACVALNNTVDVITITGELVVTYVNGSNIYVKDATGAMCIFDKDKILGAKAGSRITNLTGKYTRFSAGTKGDAFIPEIQYLVADKATVTDGEAPAPESYTVEEIGADMGATYVKFSDVTVESDKLTDATGSITLYNSFKITLTTGKAKSVTAIVMAYQGALQVAPIEIVPDESVQPSEPEKGDKEDPYTVAEAIEKYVADNNINLNGWVKGYIVGYIKGSVLDATTAKFTTEGAVATNLLLADAEGETDITKCLSVQLPSGAVRTALNLMDNANMLGAQVKIQGAITKYMGGAGLKSASAYEILKMSGIEAADKATEAVAISGMIGAVSVNGFEGTVEIYNILGQLVSATPVSGNATIPARSGIAIVKAGNVVAKVIVK